MLIKPDRTSPLKAGHLGETWRRLRHAVDPMVFGWLAMALTIVTSGGLAAGLSPLALKILVDLLSRTNTPSAALGAVAGVLSLYVGALVFQRVCEQAQAFAYAAGEQRLIRRFSGQAFAHILNLPLGFHLDHKSGGLGQSLSNGIVGLRLILTHLALTVAPVIVQIVVAGLVLSSVFGVVIGSALLAAFAAYGAVFAWGIMRLSGSVRDISAAQIDVGGATADSLMNVEAIKAYTAERRFALRHDRLLGETEERWSRFLRLKLQNGLAVSAVFGVALISVLLLAAGQLSDGKLTLGAFILINTYLLQLARPLEMLGFAIRDIGQGLAYLDTLMSILRQEPEAIERLGERESAAPLPPLPAELVFDDVSFSFGERATLRNVSFRALPGTRIGIVGPSGAGKSSLLRLILRFYEPEHGQIRLDGMPLTDLPLNVLRNQIALVSQDTILFNDTIGENIALAAETPDTAAIVAAADRARLSKFLADLPDGLDTRVGERGLKLSGGERQRVSIARAALRNARLVIFDEATAALDPATERAVWQAMSSLAQGATTLVVTHRLSTVASADEILVLDRGRIAERGRHAQLLALGGLYAQLWRAQNGHVHPEPANDTSWATSR